MKKTHGTLIISIDDLGKDSLILMILLKLQSIQSGSIKIEVNTKVKLNEKVIGEMTLLERAIFAVEQDQLAMAKNIKKQLLALSKTSSNQKRREELEDELNTTEIRQIITRLILGESIINRMPEETFQDQVYNFDIRAPYQIVLVLKPFPGRLIKNFTNQIFRVSGFC